ncbi:MAG: hypothetical protein HND58_15715 [Planctomycetota bacterium]|nr:MAG: hypothetical protein HND58_15715 [Planctomycetota bacterium]
MRELHADERRVDEAFASVVDRVGRAWIAASSPKLLIAGLVGMQIAAILTSVLIWPGLPYWFAMGVWFVPVAAYGWWHSRTVLAKSAARVADIVLADGLCPGCMYNLGAQPDEGGMVRCPECGARWSATRIARRHEFVVRTETELEKQKRWWRAFGGADAWGPTRIEDGRRQRRPIVSARLRQPIRVATGERRKRLLAARREIGRERRVRRWMVASGLFSMYAVVCISLLMSRASTGYRVIDLFIGLSMLWLVVVFPVMIVRGSMGITAEGVGNAMLRQSLCPSCGFDLDPERGADGLTECGECGAGWRVSAVSSERRR